VEASVQEPFPVIFYVSCLLSWTRFYIPDNSDTHHTPTQAENKANRKKMCNPVFDRIRDSAYPTLDGGTIALENQDIPAANATDKRDKGGHYVRTSRLLSQRRK
jgi:hypothetical protein